MAAPKVVSAKCPTCGANLPVSPGIFQVTCRYCQNVIHVEHRKPPPEVRPFGSPGAMPSRTLYVDPAMMQAGRNVGLIIALTTLIPILLPLLFIGGPWLVRSLKGAVKPFPATCGLNEKVTVSGSFETTGPIVTSVAHNCKIHIKNAKLKGATLLATDAANVELTLENVTLETTGIAVRSGPNLTVKAIGSTLTSNAAVFESDSNLQLTLEGTTLESKTAAVKSKHNLKVYMDGGKIRGQKAGIDADANFKLTMKNGAEIAGASGTAVKTTSSLKLDAEGAKLDGSLIVTSNADIEATGLTITAKDKAIAATSSLKLDLTDGSLTSLGDVAIEAESSMEVDLVNSTVQGATHAITTSSNAKVRASKKTRIVALSGSAVVGSSNSELNVADATIEATAKAFRGTSSNKVKLTQGARLSGKQGGIEAESSLEVDATGATVEGGSGPALAATSGSRVAFRQGVLKGNPALQFQRKPTSLELDGTRIEGAQQVPAR
ncbi:MAG: hypothetical protein KF795_27800 [Labilithrix sp.]|nr:hypothetical protein [Labilithrix sp.]